MSDDTTALTAALIDIEHFVRHGGWDQPTRLFALVETDSVIAADPALAERLGLRGSADGAPAGALTSIEQDDFTAGEDLAQSLAQIMWPSTVAGCAIVVERAFLPAGVGVDQIPEDPAEAADYVAHHPQHEELRVVAGAIREPAHEHAVARLRSSDELLAGPDMAPFLTAALAQTLLAQPEEDA